MAITIFRDKDCKGASQSVSANLRDLKGMAADKPGSIRLTDVRDAVLLYKNDDWHGGALFIRGKTTVNDLGSAKDGGRFGFGNCVRSVRVSPFNLKLNITIVKNGDAVPGIWQNELWSDAAMRDVVLRANGYLLAQNALLQLEIARITFRNDPKQFNLSGTESWSFPSAWKEPGEVDVIVANSFGDGKVGQTKRPCFGETVVIVAWVDSAPDANFPANNVIATTLVHELGHYLGLQHGTADGNPNNLMFPDGNSRKLLTDFTLTVDQVREMQDRLANNLARKGDRIE